MQSNHVKFETVFKSRTYFSALPMGLGSTWSKFFRVMTNASGQHMISSDGLKAALKTSANHVTVSSLTENPLTDPDLQPGARAEARTFFKSLLADEYNV